jgi:hypothetical protein
MKYGLVTDGPRERREPAVTLEDVGASAAYLVLLLSGPGGFFWSKSVLTDAVRILREQCDALELFDEYPVDAQGRRYIAEPTSVADLNAAISARERVAREKEKENEVENIRPRGRGRPRGSTSALSLALEGTRK